MGAASPELLLENTTTNLSGDQFRCVVTNALGSVTSRVASLTILALPSLIQQPTNLTVIAGKAAGFSVVAAGTAPVSDRAGSITSAAAVLTVKPAVLPVITQQPTNQIVPLGQSATFAVVLNSRPSPTYHWSKNKVALLGATNASFTFQGVSDSDAGSYTVLVKNSAGDVTSAAAELVVGPPMPLEFLSSGSLLPDGSFQIRWIGGQGMVTVEASDDLTNWQSVAHEEAASGFRTYRDPDSRTASRRFYRLRSER